MKSRDDPVASERMQAKPWSHELWSSLQVRRQRQALGEKHLSEGLGRAEVQGSLLGGVEKAPLGACRAT